MTSFEGLESRRLFAAGAIDTAYGTGGSADVASNARGWASVDLDATADAGGGIVVASVYGGKKNQLVVTRVKADGERDTSFGQDGFATTALPLNRSGDVQVEFDGRGRSLVMVSTSRGVTITRLTESGAIDKKFGKNGTTVVPIVTQAANFDVDAGGNVFVVGTSQGKTGTRGTVVRLTYRGKLDTTFGSGGAYKTPVPTNNQNKPGDAVGAAIRVLDDGSILAAADLTAPSIYGGDYDLVSLFKLDAGGTLDPTYGTAGTVTPKFYSDNRDGSLDYSLEAFTPDGQAVIGVHDTFYDDADGRTTYDKTFGMVSANGVQNVLDRHIVPSSVPDAGPDDQTIVPAVQSNGKQFAISVYGPIFRLNADNSYDATFTPANVPTPSLPIVLVNDVRVFTFSRPSDLNHAIDPSILKITAVELA